MTGKARMLAATALVVGGIGLGTAPAVAQGFTDLKWYGKAFGGASWFNNDNTTLEGPGGRDIGNFELDYDTGYTLGAAFGAYFTPNVTMELEYAYRSANLNFEAVDADISSNAVMLNALYWFNPMGAAGALQPYIGGGLGWANVDESTEDFGDFERDSALAYQAIGGVAYNVTPNWSVTGEVRWFGTDSGTFEGENGLRFDGKVETIDVLVGAAYRF